MQNNLSAYGAASTDPAPPSGPVSYGMPQLPVEPSLLAPTLDGLSKPVLRVDPVDVSVPEPGVESNTIDIPAPETSETVQELTIPADATVALDQPAVMPDIIHVPDAEMANTLPAETQAEALSFSAPEVVASQSTEATRIAQLSELVAPVQQSQEELSALPVAEEATPSHTQEVDPTHIQKPVTPISLTDALSEPHRENFSRLAERAEALLGSGVKG